jgi:general secretion pathway protein G
MIPCAKNRPAFTLVELIVVVMILGILASIAAPKLLGTSQQATDQGVCQTLSVIRDAIDHFTAEHGKMPGAAVDEDAFKAELQPYIRGGKFPSCPVGGAKNDAVLMAANDELPGAGGTDSTYSWLYDTKTGDFFINSQETSADSVTTYGEF